MYQAHKIDDDLYFLHFTRKSWPTGSNIFVVPDQNGLNVIDTGLNEPESFEGFEKCLKGMGYRVCDIHTIYLTHGHTDHIAGVNLITNHCNPRVYLSEKCIPEAQHTDMQEHYCLPATVRKIVPELRDFDILANFEQSCGKWWLEDIEIMPIRGGDVLNIGKYTFSTILVPGHDIGLLVFYEPRLKLLLSTDLFQSSGPGSALPWYTSTAGGVHEYLNSLQRVEALDVEQVFPSHGFIRNGFSEAVDNTRSIIVNREKKILSALGEGRKSCRELDKLLFGEFLLNICPWFSTITEAHLVLLEANNRIARDDAGDVFSIIKA